MILDNVKHFENQFFLVSLLHKEDHATLCTIGTETKNKCTILLHKYWNQGNFLTVNGLYACKESYPSHYELYLKKWMTTFIKELSYVESVIPQDDTSKKFLKRLVETRLEMDARTKEVRNVILLWAPSVFILCRQLCYYKNHYLLIIIVCRFNEE